MATQGGGIVRAMYKNSYSKPKELWSRLLARGERRGECLIYTWHTDRNGYARINVEGRTEGIHRVSWTLTNGPIPPGWVVMHECDTPSCFEPSHLRAGTQADNLADMYAKGRESKGHAALVREHNRREHEEATTAAGVPFDWKRCSRCQTWKAPTDYKKGGPAARWRGGLYPYCRPCTSAYRKVSGS